MNRKILSALTAAILVFPLAAAAAPGIPHQFYGSVSFQSGTTADGLSVEARVNGVAAGSSITKDGKYGINPSILFAIKTSGDWAGETANFFVNGIDTTQSFALAKGGYSKLDLTVPGGAGTITKTAADVITNTTVAVAPAAPVSIKMGESLNLDISAAAAGSAVVEKVEKLSESFFTGATAIISGSNLLNAYEIKITGAGLTIAVTMSYPDSGIDEGSIKPYRFDGASWVAVTPFTVNTAANTISFSIAAAATPYAVFAGTAAVPASGNTGGNTGSGGGTVSSGGGAVIQIRENPVPQKPAIEENVAVPENFPLTAAEALVPLSAPQAVLGEKIVKKAAAAKRSIKKEKEVAAKYTAPLIKGLKPLKAADGFKITNFIAYGTPATSALAVAERAAALGSYKAAFGRLPVKAIDWEDAINIASGKLPAARSARQETFAKSEFRKIFKRVPKAGSAADNLALGVIAYGVRAPVGAAALNKAKKTFAATYRRQPKSAADANIVRAIAYRAEKSVK